MTEQTSVRPEPAEVTPWWDDPAMPWSHKPTRSDFWCWGLLSFYALYSLAMFPLRAWLLTVPYVSAWLNGGRTALVAVGALTSVNADPHHWWLWTWLAATVSVIKWDLLFWWAGRLWGRKILDTWGGQRPRAKRWTDLLERFTRRHPGGAILLTYLPIPFTAVIYAAAGSSGVSLKRFALLDLCWAALFNGLYMYLGFRIGRPAVQLLELYGRYAMWVSIAMLVGMLAWMWWKNKRDGGPQTPVAIADDVPAKL